MSEVKNETLTDLGFKLSGSTVLDIKKERYKNIRVNYERKDELVHIHLRRHIDFGDMLTVDYFRDNKQAPMFLEIMKACINTCEEILKIEW